MVRQAPPSWWWQSVNTTFRISQEWRIRKTIPASRRWSGSPPKFNRLFNSLVHCQHSLKISCKSIREVLHKVPNRDRQTDKQTNNDENTTSLTEVYVVERWNPWPHVANRHISISQLLSLWRHSHYGVIRYWAGETREWRHNENDVIMIIAGLWRYDVWMVGGWVFLLVPAHPGTAGSPGQKDVKRLLLLLLLLWRYGDWRHVATGCTALVYKDACTCNYSYTVAGSDDDMADIVLLSEFDCPPRIHIRRMSARFTATETINSAIRRRDTVGGGLNCKPLQCQVACKTCSHSQLSSISVSLYRLAHKKVDHTY